MYFKKTGRGDARVDGYKRACYRVSRWQTTTLLANLQPRPDRVQNSEDLHQNKPGQQLYLALQVPRRCSDHFVRKDDNSLHLGLLMIEVSIISQSRTGIRYYVVSL